MNSPLLKLSERTLEGYHGPEILNTVRTPFPPKREVPTRLTSPYPTPDGHRSSDVWIPAVSPDPKRKTVEMTGPKGTLERKTPLRTVPTPTVPEDYVRTRSGRRSRWSRKQTHVKDH